MPSTVESLFAAANVEPHGVVRWGQRIPRQAAGRGTGIYVVALTGDAATLDAALGNCPLSSVAVQELLDVRDPELKLDDLRPDAAQLGARLAGFWCADEVVLYTGRAGPRGRVSVSELSDRVAEYYATPLGARSPHAGGWPLKTLAILSDLYVHYSYCGDDRGAETRALNHFAQQLSADTRRALHDATFPMPYANLEDGHRRHKRHGITGARAPRSVTRGRSAAGVAARHSGAMPTAGPTSTAATSAMVSAPEFARRLGANPKTLRAWLRGQARAGNPLAAGHEHYGRWWFTEAERAGSPISTGARIETCHIPARAAPGTHPDAHGDPHRADRRLSPSARRRHGRQR